ncbi:hypothetical protein [Stenotrophomonas sp. GD03657]|uniref:hypothetical protein n=1 Tax=Stenotrophomonas sp. GD03657 TaxID=2975363 RepID=UPI00244815B8|nr:hypothetical protein [Stenotrophomonas sp. GD03657]MDH2154281.1 hypothetical protein [Stenotrophomonas sp. GD03657]
MSTADAKKAMTEYLLRQTEEMRLNMTLVTPETLGQSMLLHLSYDNAISSFQPYVTKRTAEGEDRTVPRISTAPSLLACLMGYQTELNDFHGRPQVTSADGRKVEFAGGWIIYGLPFQYAIRPNNKLVPDASRTDEHWLIAYDKMTTQHTPVRVGKVFYDRVTYKGQDKEYPDIYIEMVIEVHPGMSLNLGMDTNLPAGYWIVETKNLHDSRSYKSIDVRRVREITKADYEQRKTLTAGLLSLDQVLPASAFW